MPLPDIPGVISPDDIAKSASVIASWQLPTGMIPWFPGGHADPWNHVEAAMALDVAGRHEQAAAAYEWLARIQHRDGSWYQYYLADSVEQDKFDANCIAYIAVGVWHHYRTTGDTAFLQAMWPVVDAALDWVIDLQQPTGEIRWARHNDGTPWSFALLTGSSSICVSLRAGMAIAAELDHARPRWKSAVALLADAIAHHPDRFAPKDRWAMDWYYPVLSGAVAGDAGRFRLKEGFDSFVIENRGVRCVSDRPWVTAAETCECALAHIAVGEWDTALALFTWAQQSRCEDGSYWTGTVYPEGIHFPADEKSTYTAAAVILTADALTKSTPAHDVLSTHDSLPDLADLVRFGR